MTDTTTEPAPIKTRAVPLSSDEPFLVVVCLFIVAALLALALNDWPANPAKLHTMAKSDDCTKSHLSALLGGQRPVTWLQAREVAKRCVLDSGPVPEVSPAPPWMVWSGAALREQKKAVLWVDHEK